jgi:hypothetical protein|tara:strand:- start:2137 stop:2679 length:543 start_codon:yes stop_codon:yes gene_type:complete
MLKKVLSEIDLYADTVQGIEIDRAKIKNDILNSFVSKKRLSKNKKDYSYQDFKVPFSKPSQWLKDYIRDHFKADYERTLVGKKEWGNVYNQHEFSYTRHQIDPMYLKDAPDYTCVYVIDIAKDSCELVIEYDDNRRKNRTWHIPLVNNKFIIFPSTQRYFISQNTSKQMNIFLTMTYEYI